MYNWRLKFGVYWTGFFFCWSVFWAVIGVRDGDIFQIILNSFLALFQLYFFHAFRQRYEIWLDREELRLQQEQREQDERRD